MSNSNIFIGWESYGQNGSNYGAYAKILDTEGEIVKSEFKIINYILYN